MAEDGDRHVLGDPINRLLDGSAGNKPSFLDSTPAHELSDAELRRELANLDEILREAPQRGVTDEATESVRSRLTDIAAEYARRDLG